MISQDVTARLSVKLRQSTASLHIEAENSGVTAALIRGVATLGEYLLLLRNLLPVYRALEAGLERHSGAPGLGWFARPELYRADSIEADLSGLTGHGWAEALPVLPSARAYAASVADAARGRGDGLLGHAYVRYLGDLSGGRILHRLLSRSLRIDPSHLSFFEFPRLADPSAYRDVFRRALDDALASVDGACVIDAAQCAFRHNIALSRALAPDAAAGADREAMARD